MGPDHFVCFIRSTHTSARCTMPPARGGRLHGPPLSSSAWPNKIKLVFSRDWPWEMVRLLCYCHTGTTAVRAHLHRAVGTSAEPGANNCDVQDASNE